MHLLDAVHEQLDVFFCDLFVLLESVADRCLALDEVFRENLRRVSRPLEQLFHVFLVLVLGHLLLEQAELVSDLRLAHRGRFHLR